MLLAVTNKIRKESKQKIKVSYYTAVDLRKRITKSINSEQLGLFSSMVTGLHNISKETHFFDLAKEVRQEINQQLIKQQFFGNFLLFGKIFPYLMTYRNQFAPTVTITNIGKIQINDDYGSFKLDEISFFPSIGIFSQEFWVAVTTFKEQMILNFITSEPSISKSTREIIADDVINYLTCLRI